MSNVFVTPWNVGHQAPLSMGFPRQEYWSIAISFSRGSSQPRDQTHCIGRWILCYWATREASFFLFVCLFVSLPYSHSILFTERDREVNSIEDSILPLTPLDDLWVLSEFGVGETHVVFLVKFNFLKPFISPCWVLFWGVKISISFTTGAGNGKHLF